MNRSDILEKAKECVCGQRTTDYGKPEDNFRTIADLWTVYKGGKIVFTSQDVAMMMTLMKIARTVGGNGSNDCFVDIAGYAACAGEIFGNDKSLGLKKI